jgi:hypothetical protein
MCAQFDCAELLALATVFSTTAVARLPSHFAHPLFDESTIVPHVIGPSLQGQRQNCGELGRLFPVDTSRRGSVVVAARRLRTINTRTPFDHVEIEFQNALLAEDQLGHRDKRELGALAKYGAAGSEEQVFYQLLRKSGPSANAAAFDIVFSSDLHRVPIESMMLVETRVLRGDDSMLEIPRDLAERNEFVSFVIRPVVNPCLQPALHVHRGGRWVNPPGCHKGQHSKRPKKRHCNQKPSNQAAESAFPRVPARVLDDGGVWIFSHTSE